MNNIQIALVVAVVTASGFVGVIAAMVGVIQRMLNGLEYREYTLAMQGIIVSGRRSVIIRVLLLTPITAAGVALALLWSQAQSTALALTALGLVCFVVGPLLVSRLFNEPWYDVIMRWSPQQIAPNWASERTRWLHFNLARLSIGAAASVLFGLALAVVS